MFMELCISFQNQGSHFTKATEYWGHIAMPKILMQLLGSSLNDIFAYTLVFRL